MSAPAPLAPSDLDVRGYDYMPLFGARLYTSEFYPVALRNPRGGLAAQKLWWVAFQQVPAGSLPANEYALCSFADFGTDMRAWNRARETAMHGFVLCSDGRHYHPVVVEIALKAAAIRAKARDKKAQQRAAKAAAERQDDAAGRQETAERRKHDENLGGGLAPQVIENIEHESACPQGRPGPVPPEGKVREGKEDGGLRPPAGKPPGGGRSKAKQPALALPGTSPPTRNGEPSRAAADLFSEGVPKLDAMAGGDNRALVGKWIKDGADPERALALIREAHRCFRTPGEELDNPKAWIIERLKPPADAGAVPETANGWPVAEVAAYCRHKAQVPAHHWPGLERVIYRALAAGADPDRDLYPLMATFVRKNPHEVGIGLIVNALKDRSTRWRAAA